VKVDGVAVGSSPISKLKVTTGPHRVQLVAPDTNAVVLDKDVEVSEGASQRVSAR
jgi:hypothetical protein